MKDQDSLKTEYSEHPLESSESVPSTKTSVAQYRIFGTIMAVVATFAVVMTIGFFNYRKKLQNVDLNSQYILRQENARLISRMDALERSLRRTERFAEKLENSVGVETGKMRAGVGPDQDSELLNQFLTNLKEKTELPRQNSLRQDWKEGRFDQAFSEKLNLKLDDLEEMTQSLELKVHEVYEAHEEKLSYWASSPSLWPVKGWLTSGFGYRYSPWGRRVKMHKGIDIAAPYGSKVLAPANGVVTFAARKGGYGLTVIVDHGFGVKTLYGHNSRLFVNEGDVIQRGQKLASVGSSGASTGPHLHYEVHVDGIPADPMNFILE